MSFPIIASSLISGLFGMIGQRQQLAEQRQENDLAFQRNQALAQQQNQYNIEQWNRENEYNLPANQIKRLKDAGLSPSLMYGNGISGLTSATSPTMSAGTPYQPVDVTLGGRRQTIGDIFNQSITNSLAQSQARKAQAEAKGNEITNQTLYQTNIANFENILSDTNLKKEQQQSIIKNYSTIQKELELMDTNIASIRSAMANDDARLTIEKLRYVMDKAMHSKNIEEASARINLTKTQEEEIKKTLPHVIDNLIKQGELTEEQINKTMAEYIISVLSQKKIENEGEIAYMQRVILNPSYVTSKELSERMTEDSALSELSGSFSYAGLIISNLIPLLKGGFISIGNK